MSTIDKSVLTTMSFDELQALIVAANATKKEMVGTFVGPIAPKAPKGPKVTLTAEEQKAKRNEAQRLLRSTPEGKAYANEASKKSIALKKARIQAELDELKAKLASLIPVAPVVAEEVAEEVVPVAEEVVPVKKAPKKSSKKAQVAFNEDAPF